jgi:hypothetical protein
MMILTLVYFAGVLIQFSQLEPSDAANLGILLILLFVTMFGSVLVVVLLEFRAVVQWASPVLHAFNIMFEGRIHKEKGVKCVASFPGKYEDEWNRIVKLSRNSIARSSVACVFLPMYTACFGTHEIDEEREDDKCFCHTIYVSLSPNYMPNSNAFLLLIACHAWANL